MRASARRVENYTHRVEIRQHQLITDEPTQDGGDDEGPSPQELLAASLAACTAITMEMYAKRKGWDIGPVEVTAEFSGAESGSPTEFQLVMRVSKYCSEDQLQRLRAVAAKCPVHRVLEGEVIIADRIELVTPATP